MPQARFYTKNILNSEGSDQFGYSNASKDVALCSDFFALAPDTADLKFERVLVVQHTFLRAMGIAGYAVRQPVV